MGFVFIHGRGFMPCPCKGIFYKFLEKTVTGLKMKKFASLLIAAAMCLGWANNSLAIDFKVRGEWTYNFIVGENRLLKSTRSGNTERKFTNDKFFAAQRVRLFMDAIASENLMASVGFQIGMQTWGQANSGGALGTDGKQVKVRAAFIDWRMPDTDLKVRMGLQYFKLPNKAGGTAVFGTRVAAIVANYAFNENFGISAFWLRPFNDNYNGYTKDGQSNYHQNYLDNMDIFGLTLPFTFDGWEVTPWAMFGMRGKNTQWQTGSNGEQDNVSLVRTGTAGYPNYTLYPYSGLMARNSDYTNNSTSKAYGSMFWAGLPIQVTAFDPWNFEFDFNYGYVEEMGRYNAYKGAVSPENLKRSSTQRQGWLAKALLEYKMDWGIPGIFGWYGSGDDSNPKNGSEKMPSLVPYGDFTSFIGDDFNTLGNWYDMDMDYSGTWGIGLRVRDMSFFTDKVKNTIRLAWWGGTNSPSMVKYMNTAYAWNDGIFYFAGPYLTTNDGLLEANWVTNYKMYENFNIELELGYIANFMDNNTWEKAGARDSSFSKQDAWKAQLKFLYRF